MAPGFLQEVPEKQAERRKKACITDDLMNTFLPRSPCTLQLSGAVRGMAATVGGDHELRFLRLSQFLQHERAKRGTRAPSYRTKSDNIAPERKAVLNIYLSGPVNTRRPSTADAPEPQTMSHHTESGAPWLQMKPEKPSSGHTRNSSGSTEPTYRHLLSSSTLNPSNPLRGIRLSFPF